MQEVLYFMIALVAIKAMWIGSDFSIYHWLRDGKKYSQWYRNRPKYPN